MASRSTFGTFTRDGMTRTAFSPAEAVELRFTGWMEQVPAPAEPEPDPDPAATKPAKPGRDDAKSTAATTGGK